MIIVTVSGRFIIGISNDPNPPVNIGFYSILGNSALAYIGDRTGPIRNGTFAIDGASTLAFIGEANEGGETVIEGEYDIDGNSSVNFRGSTGGAEGPNDFYNELIARPDVYTFSSYRNQLEVDAQLTGQNTQVISSSAATPTVVRSAGGKVAIISSTDGLVTSATPFPSGLRVGKIVEIRGHSLPALNGVFTVAAKPNSSQIQISGIIGSGAGGNAYRAGHCLFDQQVINITGHVAIPNGNYVVQIIDEYSYNLKTMAGENVGSPGGNQVGTVVGRYWEYFPGSGRVDPYSDPQDGTKMVIPVYFRQSILKQLHKTFPSTGENPMLFTSDCYFAPDTATATANGGPGKSWRFDGGANLGGPKISALFKYLNIFASAGSPTTISTGKNHYLTTGDTVTINGSGSVPNGNYTVTVTGPKTFTIPIATVSNSTNGTAVNPLEAGRFISTFTSGQMLGSEWFCAIDSADNYRPNNSPATVEYPYYIGVQSRWWSYWIPNLTGDDFTSWNANIAVPAFGPGYKIGKWNISATVDGSGVATITCLTGPHGYSAGRRVTIAGITGINGTYSIATVPALPSATNPSNGGFTGPSTFTVTGATPGASGTGTAAIHLTMMTQWLADENRDPIVIYDQIPVPFVPAGYNLFRQEWDSSVEDPLLNEYTVYVRNLVGLINPSNVTLANTSLFRRPISG